MLVVRLKRIGKKNKPAYRVVVAEHSVAVNGSFVADLGFYNPHTKTFSIDKAEVTLWLNKGAKPSNTVARLLEKEKMKHKSIVVIKYKKASKKKAEEAKPAAPAAKSEEAEVAATEVSASSEEEAPVTEEATPAESEPTETVEAAAPEAETSEEAAENSESVEAAA